MANNEEYVKSVLAEIRIKEPAVTVSSQKKPDCKSQECEDYLFDDMDEAVKAAKKAQQELMKCTLEQRSDMIRSIRTKLTEHIEELAKMEVEETGMGRYEDKILKYKLTIAKTPGIEDIQPEIITGDDGMTITEYRPFGVIGAIFPSTAPGCTPIHNVICMIAAGNSIVASPHPGGYKTTFATIKYITEAIREAGGPEHLIVSAREASMKNANQLMKNPDIKMLLATGGPGVVHAVLSSGKKAIGAGPGNPPVLVDETADIPKAGKDIIDGNSYENCIQCIGEKECIVVDCVADLLISEMQQHGAYLLKNPEDIEKLTRVVFTEGTKINKKMVGKDAKYFLQAIGISAGDEVRTIIFEADRNHPIVMEECLMPILPIVRVPDVDTGIAEAVRIEGGRRHSAIMHSRDVRNITKYAKAIETTILTKNGPSYAGSGMGGEGWCTMSIAGPTGEGVTRPRSFTRATRCCMVGELNLRSAR